MIKHIHKVLYEKEGKHGMPYRYLLNKVLKYYSVNGLEEHLEQPNK